MEFKKFVNKVIQSIDNWEGTVNCLINFTEEKGYRLCYSSNSPCKDRDFTLIWNDNKVHLAGRGIVVETFDSSEFEFQHAIIDIKKACDESFKRNVRNLLGI